MLNFRNISLHNERDAKAGVPVVHKFKDSLKKKKVVKSVKMSYL